MEDSKLSSALAFFVGNYFVTFFIVGLIAAGISLLNIPKPLRIGEVSEAFLSYHLLFAIGINNLINFVFHVLFGDVAAKFIGWENSPFRQRWDLQVWAWELQELLRSRQACRFGSRQLIPPWAFSLGAAGGHIYQMIAAHNFSPGNVGLVLPIDILMPIVGFVFLWLSYKHPQPGIAYRKLT